VTPISLFDEVTVSDGDDGFSNSERVPCVKCGTINWAYNTKFPQKGKYVCYKCHKRLASVA
jgi:hypothetical protein